MAPLRQANVRAAAVAAAPTGHAFSDLWQDLRYAARMAFKQPGFAATAVITLALGIGATTAIFSVVYGVLLKPLPFPEPERLVSVMHDAPGLNLSAINNGPATFFTYLDNQQAFEGIGAWESNQASITGRGDPEYVEVLTVSAGTLPLIRVQPVLGRVFTPADDAPGQPLRAVLTHGYSPGSQQYVAWRTVLVSKYEGAPTTAMRMSGPMRTAIMSFATCSPSRTPAS